VSADRVVHMYCGEDRPAGYWYELKIDREQLARLRAGMIDSAAAHHAACDQLDHLALLPPAADVPLAWWRPDELVDIDLLCVSDQGQTLVWLAISQRTGRVFLYAREPIAFTRS
jgi:hypothetical protein